MLIIMMGLPATGKTTLANELASVLNAVVVNKDRVREAMFAPPVLDYSSVQNDLCMEAVYQAARYILQKWPEKTVILDGRTYSKKREVKRLLDIIREMPVVPKYIECISDDQTIQERFQRRAAHPAADRDLDLYRRLKAEADPLEVARLTLDTGKLSVAQSLTRCLEYLQDSPTNGASECVEESRTQTPLKE